MVYSQCRHWRRSELSVKWAFGLFKQIADVVVIEASPLAHRARLNFERRSRLPGLPCVQPYAQQVVDNLLEGSAAAAHFFLEFGRDIVVERECRSHGHDYFGSIKM